MIFLIDISYFIFYYLVLFHYDFRFHIYHGTVRNALPARSGLIEETIARRVEMLITLFEISDFPTRLVADKYMPMTIQAFLDELI